MARMLSGIATRAVAGVSRSNKLDDDLLCIGFVAVAYHAHYSAPLSLDPFDRLTTNVDLRFLSSSFSIKDQCPAIHRWIYRLYQQSTWGRVPYLHRLVFDWLSVLVLIYERLLVLRAHKVGTETCKFGRRSEFRSRSRTVIYC